MASLSTDKKGNRTIQFVGGDKKRRSIRLGKMPLKTAEAIKLKVEKLVAAKISGHAFDNETAVWVAALETAMAEKLVAVGLIQQPGRRTLKEFVDSYIESRTDLKSGTRHNLELTALALEEFFGPTKMLLEVSEGDAEDFRRFLLKDKAENTARRMCGRARQFFTAARKKRLIQENPFAEIKTTVQGNPGRLEFVSRDDAERVIRACPNSEWRLLFAFARYGGLRIPSEIQRMKWEDINWAENRILVRSPKTEHHVGGDCRIIPLFPELKPHLEELFDQAEPGTVYVFSERMRKHTKPATTMEKIIRKAAVRPWGKPFQNPRSSRETELTDSFPVHVVVNWLGNSQPVAMKHYLQVTPEHFDRALNPDKALQNPVQYPAVHSRKAPQGDQTANPQARMMRGLTDSCDDLRNESFTRQGFEAVDVTCSSDNDLQELESQSAAESGAVFLKTLIPADLQELIRAWGNLTDSTRQAILTLLRADQRGGR